MKLPPEVLQLLKVAAPTLATAFGTPLAGVAAAAATAALERWLYPDGMPGDGRKATPGEIADCIKANADDPRLLQDLRLAEVELLKLEEQNNFRFAALEVQDREGARRFARDTGSAGYTRRLGLAILVYDGLLTFLVVAGAGAVMAGAYQIADPILFSALTAFVGGLVGRATARADTYINFVFGSSAGSKEKTDRFGDAFVDLGRALAERPQASAPLPAPAAAPVVVLPQQPTLVSHDGGGPWRQGPHGGRRWRLTPGGVVAEGEAEPMRTVGQPVTVRRIWRDFGPHIQASAARNGVPLELIVATIATESRGIVRASLTEPDGRQSVGLMQTLTGTASEVMGGPVSPQDLLDPALSIEAGTRYIARQRRVTDYQPPLVAAAYNAGGLYPPREQDDNPWRLRSTGDHVSRFCQFYGDCAFVAAEDGWGTSV